MELPTVHSSLVRITAKELGNLLECTVERTNEVTIDYIDTYVYVENLAAGHPSHVCWVKNNNNRLAPVAPWHTSISNNF